MMVTGVQPVGARNLGGVQVSLQRDPVTLSRAGDTDDADDRADAGPAARTPQPVVLPRDGVPVDGRPLELRRAEAIVRYQRDGGRDDEDDDEQPRGDG